mmetsp:Transcript_156074/g.478981  ORF Transcript_156074/g.478981 Transcript_156074/m.478981 type:complete len:237 (+) Transcript_156074:526-1236(+)
MRRPPSRARSACTAASWLPKSAMARPVGRPSMPKTTRKEPSDSCRPVRPSTQGRTSEASAKKGKPSKQSLWLSEQRPPKKDSLSVSRSTTWKSALAWSSSCVARRTIQESSKPQCSSPIISTFRASQICFSVDARLPLMPWAARCVCTASRRSTYLLSTRGTSRPRAWQFRGSMSSRSALPWVTAQHGLPARPSSARARSKARSASCREPASARVSSVMPVRSLQNCVIGVRKFLQ